MERSLIAGIEDALGTSILGAAPVRGGDVAIAYRLDLADGRRMFAKTHRNPPPQFFVTEASGLSWLADAGAVDVPEVIAVSDRQPAFLVLSWIDEGRAGPTTDADFGRQLAALHRAGAPCFGREDRRTTGSRALPNDPTTTWVEFYAQCRLLPLARLAHDAAALDHRTLEDLVTLAGRLDRFAGPDEPAARLHGDLWAGNRVIGEGGRSWLVDPAAHGGHREFDLAMMRLFGGFGTRCFDAYGDELPLADEWSDRVALHQIAPLVVHAIKFGGGYVAAATSAIAQYAR